MGTTCSRSKTVLQWLEDAHFMIKLNRYLKLGPVKMLAILVTLLAKAEYHNSIHVATIAEATYSYSNKFKVSWDKLVLMSFYNDTPVFCLTACSTDMLEEKINRFWQIMSPESILASSKDFCVNHVNLHIINFSQSLHSLFMLV